MIPGAAGSVGNGMAVGLKRSARPFWIEGVRYWEDREMDIDFSKYMGQDKAGQALPLNVVLEQSLSARLGSPTPLNSRDSSHGG